MNKKISTTPFINTNTDINDVIFNNEKIDICDVLDYAKISTFLLTNSNKRSCALLIQALRQVSLISI